LLGQNGAFSSALLITALVLSAQNARVAGCAGAFLTIKPQIGLLLPAAWAGGRQWKIFVYAALVFLVIFTLTIALFGVQACELYFRDTFPEMGRIMDEPFPQGFQVNAITMFMFARAFGAPVHTARITQMVLTVIAFVTTYKIWSDDGDLNRKLASTIFLGLLAMPYGYTYDMIGYEAALALILQQCGLSPIWVALWLWPALSRDITVDLRVPVTSLVIFVAAIWTFHLPKTQEYQRT
jgi:hypothetical protein